jgi:hypothetical protein
MRIILIRNERGLPAPDELFRNRCALASLAGLPYLRDPMPDNLTYRLGVLSRLVAAVGGGYFFASILAVCIARWLPLPRASATMAAVLSTFLLHALAVIWVFAARTALAAWGGLALPLLVCGLYLLASGPWVAP